MESTCKTPLSSQPPKQIGGRHVPADCSANSPGHDDDDDYDDDHDHDENYDSNEGKVGEGGNYYQW